MTNESVDQLVRSALNALRTANRPAFAAAVARVAYRPEEPGWQRQGEVALSLLLRSLVTAAWTHGWEPADLVRICERRLSGEHTALLRDVVAAELSGYAPATVDPRWSGQAEELGIRVWWSSDRTHLAAALEAGSAPWLVVVEQSVEVALLLMGLPQLERLGPIPGTAVRTPAPVRDKPLDERILSRVRALLAKAESTTFPAEAETFTAGAQALMARHSIDLALLAAAEHCTRDRPSGRRIGVENPYDGAKASLLDSVARANRCKVVWNKELGFCTVLGFAGDLDAVELLFTSLLLQATAAMARAGSRTDGIGRSRTRSFRQSFLLAYASRIGERLVEATRMQTAQAVGESSGTELLPVLARRETAVQESFTELFPRVRNVRAGAVRDGEGWASGTSAADLAALQAGSALPGS